MRGVRAKHSPAKRKSKSKNLGIEYLNCPKNRFLCHLQSSFLTMRKEKLLTMAKKRRNNLPLI
ncbi:hypothetical protein CQA43_08690 [Helicobacter ganmani]|uniref:Uncharacterized protein n=1 Tax=Helicobacter ganmani TaxID=60246 RepID=A0A3D8I9F7_9HELI|nr:hypothetical protein CQA43_08690 [Helicobacter ganmani]